MGSEIPNNQDSEVSCRADHRYLRILNHAFDELSAATVQTAICFAHDLAVRIFENDRIGWVDTVLYSTFPKITAENCFMSDNKGRARGCQSPRISHKNAIKGALLFSAEMMY